MLYIYFTRIKTTRTTQSLVSTTLCQAPGHSNSPKPPLRGSNRSGVTGAMRKEKQGKGRGSCSVWEGQGSLSDEVTMEQRK